MAPSPITEDYYQVLEISQTADATTIKSSYRRLAKLRHPDKLPNDPAATAQFQLLQTAYATLIDAGEREEYDIQYARIRSNRQTLSGNSGAFPYQARTWTTGAAPQTGGQAQSAPDGEESQHAKRRMEELRKIFELLEARRRNLEAESFKVQQAMNRIQEALDRLQEEEDKDAQQDTARKSWFAFLYTEHGHNVRSAGRGHHATSSSPRYDAYGSPSSSTLPDSGLKARSIFKGLLGVLYSSLIHLLGRGVAAVYEGLKPCMKFMVRFVLFIGIIVLVGWGIVWVAMFVWEWEKIVLLATWHAICHWFGNKLHSAGHFGQAGVGEASGTLGHGPAAQLR